MYYGKRTLILTAVLAMLAGTGLHFLYSWMPNAVTALFSPINESLWEHIKIIFWPYLLCAFWLNRGRPGGIRPWLLVAPALCVAMLVLGYLYHITLGGDQLWVDIAIFVVVMAVGFWLPTQFSGPFEGVRWMLPIALTILMVVLIAVFTLFPPQLILFADLSGANAWLQIPC